MPVLDTYEKMKDQLAGVVPDVELKIKAELVDEIEQLKQERNAVILGHNYMEPSPSFTRFPTSEVTRWTSAAKRPKRTKTSSFSAA